MIPTTVCATLNSVPTPPCVMKYGLCVNKDEILKEANVNFEVLV